jgi:hypothetical protein
MDRASASVSFFNSTMRLAFSSVSRPNRSSSVIVVSCRPVLACFALALSGCTVVDHGRTLNFDTGGKSAEAFQKARNACRYEVERMEFRSRRDDHDSRLFIACMEAKGFAFRRVSGHWVDRLCPEGTPGRRPDGICRERVRNP